MKCHQFFKSSSTLSFLSSKNSYVKHFRDASNQSSNPNFNLFAALLAEFNRSHDFSGCDFPANLLSHSASMYHSPAFPPPFDKSSAFLFVYLFIFFFFYLPQRQLQEILHESLFVHEGKGHQRSAASRKQYFPPLRSKPGFGEADFDSEE